MQNRVFVLGQDKEPLMPCHPARARQMLKQRKASVYRRFPFTIILKQPSGSVLQPLRKKTDPGAKTTGIALVATFKRGLRCIFAAEVTHRSFKITKKLLSRRAIRRSRRSRKTRYRKPRFKNRTRPKGWLPPSLKSRVEHILSWTRRLARLAPITALSLELNRFDTQKLQNPDINGVEYQQGTLFGYHVKEYLLDKWGRMCVYCKKKGVPLQVEHMTPKSRGGSNRVSNLTLACESCNQKKGNKTAAEFGHEHLTQKAGQNLRAAGQVNATHLALVEALKGFDLPLECGFGAQTKYNRSQQGYTKEHWLDALCIGDSGAQVFVEQEHSVLEIKAMGWGSRQMCLVDKYGFPRTGPKSVKQVHGFQTGDTVKAIVPKGKKKGSYIGRVAVRESGYFNIKTKAKTIQGISYKHCKVLQKVDGYTYSQRKDGVSSRP